MDYDGQTVAASIDDSQRRALLEGAWDTTSLLWANVHLVQEMAISLPYVDVAMMLIR